jgi:predicted RNA polymerase sigma factor
VALTLNTAGGLSAREIAAAFLVSEATAAQRIVRAKRILRETGDAAVLPAPADLPDRRDAVLQALYLMFTEGYAATEGDLVVRRELCHEAIRLAEILAGHPATAGPGVHAHLALFCLQASRLPARTAPGGGLLLLAEQDRSLWDRELLSRGMVHLERAGRGEELTPVHLEAGIASCHAVAPDFEATDWEAVARYYELLEAVAPSPVVRLNRAVAVGMARGAEAGLALLAGLEGRRGEGVDRSHLLPAVRGWLLARAGRPEESARAYTEAAGLARSAPVRAHLEGQARS